MLRFAIFCTNEQKLLKIRTTFHLPGDYFWTNRNCHGFGNSLTLGLRNQKMLWVGHDYAAGSCCDLDLQGSDPKCCARRVVSLWWSFLWNSFKIQLQITKIWDGQEAHWLQEQELDGVRYHVHVHVQRHVLDTIINNILNYLRLRLDTSVNMWKTAGEN